MSARIDLVGNVFGDLVVIAFEEVRGTHAYWRVKCQVCDLEKTSSGSNLLFGMTSNCNSCYQESRCSLDIHQRFALRKDISDGLLSNRQIMAKYGINRAYIYGVNKSKFLCHDIERINRLYKKEIK